MRRKLISILTGLALAAASVAVLGQTYPSRPIKIIQGFAPGGNADTVARVVGAEMAKGLGQPIIVEAKPGAGGNIAADVVAKAAPDGYTLYLITGGHAVSGALRESLPYKTVEDFQMLSTISVFSFVLSVRADGPHRSLSELIKTARAKPGAVTYGTAGVGATQHLTGELLSSMAAANLLHIPYKGDSAAITGILGGDVDFVITPATAALPHIKAGKFKAIAVSGNSRWPGLPDTPTVAEAGVPDFDVRSWVGLATTAGVPKPIVEQVHKEIVRTLRVADVRAKLESFGGEGQASTPDELRDRVAREKARWDKVIAEAKIPKQ